MQSSRCGDGGFEKVLSQTEPLAAWRQQMLHTKRLRLRWHQSKVAHVQPILKKMVVNAKSAMMTATMVSTTVFVVAFPTPAAPPVTLSPLWQAIALKIRPKTEALIKPV